MKRFLAGATLALLMSGGAAADVAPDAILAGIEAGDALGGYMAELEASEKRLPKLSDPKGAELLKALFNADALTAGRPQSPAGAPDLAAWNDVARAAVRRYLDATASDDRVEAERRLGEYQDELTLAFVFLTRAMANLSQGVQARIEALPNAAGAAQVREDGRQIMRAGLMGVAQGALMTAGASTLRPENARAVTAALADDMPLFAPMLTQESAIAIRRMAEVANGATQDPDTNANLSRIVWSPIPEARPAAEGDAAPAIVAAADRQSWARAMSEAIRARVRYPQDLKDAQAKGAPLASGKTMVALTIDRNGAVLSAVIAESAGEKRLDETALEVVREAAPYPRPPAEVEGEQVAITVPINFIAATPEQDAPAAEAPPAANPKAPPRKAAASKPGPSPEAKRAPSRATERRPAAPKPGSPPRPGPAAQP